MFLNYATTILNFVAVSAVATPAVSPRVPATIDESLGQSVGRPIRRREDSFDPPRPINFYLDPEDDEPPELARLPSVDIGIPSPEPAYGYDGWFLGEETNSCGDDPENDVGNGPLPDYNDCIDAATQFRNGADADWWDDDEPYYQASKGRRSMISGHCLVAWHPLVSMMEDDEEHIDGPGIAEAAEQLAWDCQWDNRQFVSRYAFATNKEVGTVAIYEPTDEPDNDYLMPS